MPRGANTVRSKSFRISTTTQVVQLLDELAATGFYGKNRAEVAEQILRNTLREEVRRGPVSFTPKKKR